MRRILSTIVCMLVISSVVLAQTKPPIAKKQQITPKGGISCGSDPILPTDGSSIDDVVFNTGPNWYLVHLKAGHSYSVETWDSTDTVIAGSATLALISTTNCVTPIPTTDVTAIDPDLSNDFGARMSWIQAGDSDAYVQLATSDPAGNTITIRVTDTTLYNQRWSTFGGFQTQYSFINNTEVSISGTLTIYLASGAVANTVPITIAPLTASFYIFSTPVKNVGFATFAFVGPAGSITTDAYFINSTATVVVPTNFGPRNYQH